MKVMSLMLAITLSASPVLAQQQPQSIRESADRAAATATQQHAERGRGKLFWPGIIVGVAGVTTAVLGTTAFRVEDRSTGNAPPGAYQACVARKSDPIYASSQCDALKGKNVKLLWSGAALGALGAVMMIGGARTSAELSPGIVRFVHRIRF